MAPTTRFQSFTSHLRKYLNITKGKSLWILTPFTLFSNSRYTWVLTSTLQRWHLSIFKIILWLMLGTFLPLLHNTHSTKNKDSVKDHSHGTTSTGIGLIWISVKHRRSIVISSMKSHCSWPSSNWPSATHTTQWFSIKCELLILFFTLFI